MMEVRVANLLDRNVSHRTALRSGAKPRVQNSGKMKQIAVSGCLNSPHMYHLLKGVQNACLERGYHLLLHFAEHGQLPQDRRKLWEQKNPSGVLGIDEEGLDAEDWSAYVLEHQVPYVSLGGYAGDTRICTAMTEHDRNIELALDYLWELTRLTPVFVRSKAEGREKPSELQRLAAYRRWMARHGLEPVEPVIQSDGDLHWIASLQLPSALLADTSRDAIAIYRAAARLGIPIGRRIHVMAADNVDNVNEHLVPALSSIQVPYADMGYAAAMRLIDYIEGDADCRDTGNIVLDAVMFKGESAGAVDLV